jgi:predicted RNA methylase
MNSADAPLVSLILEHLEHDRSRSGGFDSALAYHSRKTASAELDLRLGFDLESAERRVREARRKDTPDDRQDWSHLSPQVFQTPYAELAEIVERTDPAGELASWTDLGCAYGRLGLVLSAIRPRSSFEGLEVEPARVEEARRIFAKWSVPGRFRVSVADVDAVTMPDCDAYFVYDFGTRDAVERALERLRERARERKVVVVGRARRVRDAIERAHPWLGSVVAPEHHGNYSIYRSR